MAHLRSALLTAGVQCTRSCNVVMLLSLGRYVLFGMVAALAGAAGGTLAPAGPAAAQPQPTMVLSPASGPCDATVEVRGSGFPLPSGPMESLGLYLLQPGTADLNMGVLNPASVQRDGTFSEWAPLWKRGCEAAALDGKAEQPTGNLFIAARSGETPVGPGERIPNIIAVARYAYTTTTPHVPTESLSVSPQSGPCDAMVDVRGEGFEPGTEIPLDLAKPNTDDVMGRLAVATADSDGKFSARVSLGDVGCEAAALYDRFASPGSPREIEIYAGSQPDVLFVAARASYAYTTIAPGRAEVPQSLPNTGQGATSPGRDIRPLAVVALLSGVLLFTSGFVAARRRLR